MSNRTGSEKAGSVALYGYPGKMLPVTAGRALGSNHYFYGYYCRPKRFLMRTGQAFPSPEWEKFMPMFKRQDVAAKTVLLHEGEVSKRSFFVLKGCLRVSFNNQGKDITTQFFFEKQGVASIESFRTGKPSLFSIEAIEPSRLYVLAKKDFETIMAQSQVIKEEIESHIFNRLLLYQHLFISRIKDSPEERYKDLLRNHPEILQRVPLHYIASYLGITPVSLSRIRNRR